QSCCDPYWTGIALGLGATALVLHGVRRFRRTKTVYIGLRQHGYRLGLRTQGCRNPYCLRAVVR
ncbi:MAG: hypothetical protein D6823_12630, partial [Chloroflexi bacterium]